MDRNHWFPLCRASDLDTMLAYSESTNALRPQSETNLSSSVQTLTFLRPM